LVRAVSVFFLIRPAELLEEKRRSFGAKIFGRLSFQNCDLGSLKTIVVPVVTRLGSAEFPIQMIPKTNLFFNSLLDPRQVIAFHAHKLTRGTIINGLLEKVFPVGPNIIHIIKHMSSVPWVERKLIKDFH